MNVSQNIQICPNSCMQATKLSWDNKGDMESIFGVDTIIGSQLAYDKENVIRLMDTIRYYRAMNPKLKVMIAYQKYSDHNKNLQIKFGEYFGK